MLKMKLMISISTIVILGGCASVDPMKTLSGPMYTPVFEPVALDVVKDGSKSIRFKEFTIMYENGKFQSWGVFFITENSVYLANWNTHNYKYTLRYSIPLKDIASITDDIVERSVFPDSKLLVLSDKNGHKVGFALYEKYAVRLIIEELREPLNNSGPKPA
jgi:hypothetical protein